MLHKVTQILQNLPIKLFTQSMIVLISAYFLLDLMTVEKKNANDYSPTLKSQEIHIEWFLWESFFQFFFFLFSKLRHYSEHFVKKFP